MTGPDATRPETPATASVDLQVHDLGRRAYAEAHALQRQRQREVIEGRADPGERGGRGAMHLLLVEHDPPVITVSRRPGARRHLVASPAELARQGIEVAETDRGGDITYHGPGQLVVYPILDLNVLGLRVHSFMRFLEQVVIDTIARFGLEGCREPDATGVWVTRAEGREGERAAKICAMGVRVSRWVSMHGLALNVTTNLGHFDLIVPCGLAGRQVTSMARELGERCPALGLVKRTMVEEFRSSVTTLCGEAAHRPGGGTGSGRGGP